MTDSNVAAILQELMSFRSRLFVIDSDEESSHQQMRGILDDYRNNLMPFAEEYLIAGFDLLILNDDIRSKVEELTVNEEIPSIRNKDVTFWDRDRLLFCLLFDNEKVFSEGLKLIIAKKPEEIEKFNIELKYESGETKGDSNDDYHIEMDDIETLESWRNVSLIKVAVLRELNTAIGQLGSLKSDINSTAIHLVYECGRWECLRFLLDKRNSKRWQPVKLSEFITFLIRAQTFDKDFQEHDNPKVDFDKCVDLLFKYATYETNEQNDDHYTPLHLAVVYNKTKIIFELLKNGAYIGVCDRMDRPAIWNINPKTLEKYLDTCIQGEDMIVFNFDNLIASSNDHPNDMAAIKYISNSNELKHLLEHPLIASFLFLKWNRLALLFYVDFVCYFLLSLSIGCISIYFIQDPNEHIVKMSMAVLMFVIYATLRRLLQVIFCTTEHRHSFITYCNVLLTISIVAFLIVFVISVPLDFHSSTAAAICIILISYEFFTMAGTFWHFSIYSEMFIAVAKSSIKSLQLYAIFLPAFSLLFYILLRDKEANEIDDRNDLNKFPTLGASVVKTIVMSAGEFDMINVRFDANDISVYIFVGYVFLITIVFMNLLNGLAVSDTHKIQSKAELTSYRRRCQVLAHYEDVLSNKTHWFRTRYHGLWRICKNFTQFNTFVYRDKRIYVELEDDSYRIYSVKETSSNVMCLRVPLRSWCRFRSARMSSKIVRHALKIREKNEMHKVGDSTFAENDRNKLENRIVKMEKSLKKIEKLLYAINNKMKQK